MTKAEKMLRFGELYGMSHKRIAEAIYQRAANGPPMKTVQGTARKVEDETEVKQIEERKE